MILVIGMLFLGWYLSYDDEEENVNVLEEEYISETSPVEDYTDYSDYSDDEYTQVEQQPEEETSSAEEVDPVAEQSGLALSLVSGPRFDNIKRVYSIEVRVENYDGAALKYEVFDYNGNLIKTEPSTKMTLDQSDSGVYYIRAINENSGQSSDPLTVTGCEPKKMSPERLLEICSSGDYTTMKNSEAYQFNPELELAFNGVEQDIWAHSISEICTRISLEIWKSVSISSIEYDDNYRISRVEFDVELP